MLASTFSSAVVPLNVHARVRFKGTQTHTHKQYGDQEDYITFLGGQKTVS